MSNDAYPDEEESVRPGEWDDEWSTAKDMLVAALGPAVLTGDADRVGFAIRVDEKELTVVKSVVPSGGPYAPANGVYFDVSIGRRNNGLREGCVYIWPTWENYTPRGREPRHARTVLLGHPTDLLAPLAVGEQRYELIGGAASVPRLLEWLFTVAAEKQKEVRGNDAR